MAAFTHKEYLCNTISPFNAEVMPSHDDNDIYNIPKEKKYIFNKKSKI